MAQYQQIKAENKDAFLFFRLGDFYELFGDDAVEASRLLEITLTARGSGEGRINKIPMCGVPYHAANHYINKLLKAGKKVAIVEQVEDPKKAKGMVKRELVKIITPGTKLLPESLEAKENNYLTSLAMAGGTLGLAAADLSTGEFRTTEFKGPQAESMLMTELNRLNPSECLVPDDMATNIRQQLTRNTTIYVTTLEGYRFDPDAGRSQLTEYFQTQSLDGFGISHFSSGLGAAAALLYYMTDTQKCRLDHIQKIVPYTVYDQMGLDDATIRNLELTANLQDHTRNHTLLQILDHTLTAMGGRRLHQWLVRPLVDLDKINHRQAAVAELVSSTILRQALADALTKCYDLERLAGRLGSGTAHPRDLAALRSTLGLIPTLKEILKPAQSYLLGILAVNCPACEGIKSLLDQALVDDPPLTLKDGGVIRTGYHAQVDELRNLSQTGKRFITELQQQERERTGIGNLKIEFNSVFGYYIEVTKSNSKNVPDDYQRKQTLVNAERYITPALKAYEEKVLHAQESLVALEQDLFQQLRTALLDDIQQLLQAADHVATWDGCYALAEAAVRNNYCQPQLNQDGPLLIKDGRHPVVEQLVTEKFIPNDLDLDHEHHLISVITGPNMAGKSTYLRQNALIVIMAQMGSFVPAREARLSMIDRVFTRVGAADNLAGGQSTFMVEMNETASILNNATERSLVILDEVGRGTSTFDGVSIAWAVAEYLHDRVKAKTLFATHYYELTELALSMPKIKNNNIAVKEWKDDIIFLRKIMSGSADRSYGIQVARLAGLPEPVLKRAREVLTNLENANYTDSGSSRLAVHTAQASDGVPGLFGEPQQHGPGQAVVEALKNLPLNELTPLEALNHLAKLKTLVE